MSAPQSFQRLALIGLGLLGSSIGHVVKRRGLAKEIVGTARSVQTRAKALELGFVDRVEETVEKTVKGADLIIVCTPIGTFEAIGRAMEGRLQPGAIVTDVGSTKQSVIRDLGPFIPEGVHFIPSHPIAGTEHSGPEAGFAELFENRWCILTPVPGSDAAAIQRLTDFWEACGSMVDIMAADHHDKVLAITSHLPHLIAYTIVATASDTEEGLRREVIKYSAGGFRDFTRIAASDPVMWRDVFLNNREAVLEMLQRFSEDLTSLQRAIRWGEGDKLEALFTKTREIRRGIIDAHQAGHFDPREAQDEQEQQTGPKGKKS